MSAELNRIILLSDGLANRGETNPDVIATDVHGLAQRGASTTTLGLGDDYNEDLLEAMAAVGTAIITTLPMRNNYRLFLSGNCKV
ncbi:hypothetical protein NON20_25060 (plasmid) [Synechocystis sp. B12]|nr:hypothetical protein NON20_25060 [Synechocystis sp. B12]